jgi:polar amino acid transport system substrate-binding protein
VLLVCVLAACAGSTGPASSTLSSASSGAEPITPQPKRPQLHLVSSRWPPFTDVSDRPAVALVLVDTALDRAGYGATHEILPPEEVNTALTEGRFDGSAALWPSEARSEYLLYSEPYLENRLVLVAPAGVDVSARSLEALDGARVGIVKGYAYGPEVEQVQGPELVAGESTERNLRDMLDGELDYVLVDALVVHHLMEHQPQRTAKHLSVGEHALLTRSLHLGVQRSRPDAEALIAAFNAELRRMRGDGTYHSALGVRWIEADVDGDGEVEMIAAGDQVGAEAPSAGYALIAGTGERRHPAPDQGARFVVEGVPYDTWEAVPPQYKVEPEEFRDKPRTLRMRLLEF